MYDYEDMRYRRWYEKFSADTSGVVLWVGCGRLEFGWGWVGGNCIASASVYEILETNIMITRIRFYNISAFLHSFNLGFLLLFMSYCLISLLVFLSSLVSQFLERYH